MANSGYVAGHEVRQEDKVKIRFIPIEQCPVVGDYVVRPISLLEIRDSQRNLIKKII